MSGFTVDPLRVFEVNNQVCQLNSVYVLAPIAAGTVLIAGVTGKKQRIMGWIIQSTGAIGGMTLKSSGGTVLHVQVTPINTGPTDKLPIVESGYFETVAAGEGITVDVITTTATITLFYITYTP